MSILRRIADFFLFRARAATLARKVDDGVLSAAERERAVSLLLLAPLERGAQSARQMAAKTAAI
jgi:hypothetical protein